MQIRHPECDVRPWLVQHGAGLNPYTKQRIEQSYSTVDTLLASREDMSPEAAIDVGCGSGFETFALGRYFDHVLAIDIDRQAIREARAIAVGASVSNVEFRRRNAETLRARHEFEFAYCNLMSHNVRSRPLIITRLREALRPCGIVAYSEITEGYAPMEIHRAIARRDQAQLSLRIWQIVRGVIGRSGFRFFQAGSARTLFEAAGFCLLTQESYTWNGLPFLERSLARGNESPRHSRRMSHQLCPDPTAGFPELRRLFEEMIASHRGRGFSPDQRTSIREFAETGRDRFAPFALFLLMGDLAGALRPWADSVIVGRLRHAWERAWTLVSASPGGNSLPGLIDWPALSALDHRFLELTRRIAGLPIDAIES